jgi:hypothetical protein
VEGDVVEVGDDLVDRGGRGATASSASTTVAKAGVKGGLLGCEAVIEQALDENVLVVEEKHGGGRGTSPPAGECRSRLQRSSVVHPHSREGGRKLTACAAQIHAAASRR